MSEIDAAVFLAMWWFLLPFIVIAMREFVGSFRVVVSLLFCNAVVLFIFSGLWFWGIYFSVHWLQIIYLGAAWLWLGASFAVSYAASFISLRKHSKAMAKSLFGPAITVPALWTWILICELVFYRFP